MRLFSGMDGAAAADPGQPLETSTLFMREDLLVRVIDLRGTGRDKPADPGMDAEPGKLGPLLDPGPEWHLTTGAGTRDFLASCAMDLITDREVASEQHPGHRRQA